MGKFQGFASASKCQISGSRNHGAEIDAGAPENCYTLGYNINLFIRGLSLAAIASG